MARLKDSSGRFIISQFCVHGHDTFICGRYTNGACRDCIGEKHPKQAGGQHKQICIHGHDTAVCGRDEKSRCIQCKEEQREQVNERTQKWAQDHKEELKEYKRQWQELRREEIRRKKHEYYESKRDEFLQKAKEYQQEHPEVHNAAIIRNNAKRSLRVVAWTDWDIIKEFDKNKPKGMTIDHIIPLQGDDVAGLHVSWNLQYMDGPSNTSKFNHCNLLEASEWYGKILEKFGLK